MHGTDLGAFKRAAGIAFAIVVGVHIYQVFASSDPGVLLACNLLVLLMLAVLAAREQRRSGSAFPSAVAAETIVAFGVLALILGLVTALVPLMLGGADSLAFDLPTLRRIGLPFAQGLASAGLAPVIAVLVRINGAEGEEDDVEDAQLAALEAMRAALSGLTAELDEARGAARGLHAALAEAAINTARIAPEVARHLDAVVTAAGHVAPAIAGSLASASTAIDGAGAALAGEMNAAAQQVAGGFGDTHRHLAALSAAAQSGGADLTRLSGAFGKLSTNAEETAGLLDALNTLTASVETFLARRA